MKKFLKTLAVGTLSLVMGLSVFSGCNLITTDSERDMNQVVATVRIAEDAPTEEILKKDLVMMYLNYGYSYVQQGTYTQKQAFEMLMEQLVNNAIMVQQAMLDFSDAEKYPEYAAGVKEYGVFDPQAYLDETEKEEALYNTNKSINDLIESFKDEEEDETEKETVTETTRVAPTDAANYEEPHEGYESYLEFYKAYNTDGESFLDKGVITGFDDDYQTVDADTKRAYNKVISRLEDNALIGEDFDYNKDSIYDTDYYKDTLRSNQEAIVIENYEKKLTADIYATVSFADLEANYKEMYDAQKNGSVSDYETTIDGAGTSSPIVYNPYAGYGFVYNLLLGVDDKQEAQIAALGEEKNLSEAEYREKREEILYKTTAKDLRSTWITAGYDFDYATKKFTGDYTFTTAENSFPFQGDVKWLNEADKPAEGEEDEDYEEEYEITYNPEYDLAAFVKIIDDYLYGTDNVAAEADPGVYYRMATPKTQDYVEFDEKMNELLFAFSTDDGSLNTYKGYVVKPPVDVDGTETYVKEFADASREVLTMADGGYIVVGTDYGYHFIFKSQTISAKSGYETLESYLDSLGVEKKIGDTTYDTWEEYYNAMISDIEYYLDEEGGNASGKNDKFYLYQLQQAYVSNFVSTRLTNKQTEIVNRYKLPNEDGEYEEYNEEYVKIYTERYSELLKD